MSDTEFESDSDIMNIRQKLLEIINEITEKYMSSDDESSEKQNNANILQI
jgi:hypothetical protein